MFILNKENFSAKAQEILNGFYLQPLSGTQKANPQDGYIERRVHGAMHATRATVWAMMMQNVLAEITPTYTNTALQKIAAFTGEDIDTVKLIILFTMLCHDIARKGEGNDIWEAQSRKVAFKLLIKLGLTENNAKLFSQAIIYKDKRDQYRLALEKLNISKEDLNDFDYIRVIINLGDNLDIVRCVNPFDSNFIFRTLSPISGYNAATHDSLIMRLIIAVHQFVFDQGDMLFDCDVENRTHEVVATHPSSISSQKKVAREHADNVFDIMLHEASECAAFQPYLTFLAAKPASYYAGALAFDPYIHGTNSSILALLPKTDFQLMSPMEMLDEYQVAPMTGELTEGGFQRVGDAAIKDETHHGKTSFSKMSDNGDVNAYTLEEVIATYTNLKTEKKNAHLIRFQNELDGGLSAAYSNINLLAIYFTRARLTHDSLEEVISPEQLETLTHHLNATVQYFYFIRLLGVYIHPNFDVLSAQPDKPFITEAIRVTFTFKYIVRQIIKHNIDMKEIVENPTEINLQRALIILELPERITFTHYNFNIANYRKEMTIEPAVRQLFCLNPGYKTDNCVLEPIYTFDRMSQNKVDGYKINDIFYFMLREQLKPELFFNQFSKLAVPHIIALKDRIRLFQKLVSTPQSAFVLTDLETSLLSNPFPIIVITENEEKLKLTDFTHQEFRSRGRLRLGTDITMIATNAEEHRLFLMNYLVSMGFQNVEVVLFDDLMKSKLTKKRPPFPREHNNEMPALQMAFSNSLNQAVPNEHIDVEAIPAALPEESSDVLNLDNKKAILESLTTFLSKSTLTKEMILDCFDELKKKEGLYKALHEQKNPGFDRFRLFFKRNVNAGESYFWHTKSYQQAVKLLKEAYVKISPAVSDANIARENAFIDYVRGNAPVHHRKTSTRKFATK